MTRPIDAVKAAVRIEDVAERYLKRAKAGHPYVCPHCGSGGNDRAGSDSALELNAAKQYYKCHSCHKLGDVIDLLIVATHMTEAEAMELYGATRGLTPDIAAKRIKEHGIASDDLIRLAAAERLSWEYNVPLDYGNTAAGTTATTTAKADSAPPQQTAPQKATESPDTAANYRDGQLWHKAYIEAAQANIGASEAINYLKGRGISYEQAVSCGLGYDPARRAIVIPFMDNAFYHCDRYIDRDGGHKYDKPPATWDSKSASPDWPPVGRQPLNGVVKAFDYPAFFIVEGYFDALSLQLAGYPVVCMGGTQLIPELLAAMNAAKYEGVPILAYDNDKGGADAARRCAEAMDAAGIEYVFAQGFNTPELNDGVDGYKDVSELFTEQRSTFMQLALSSYEAAGAIVQKRKDAEYGRAMRELHAMDSYAVIDELLSLKNDVSPIATGFENLDEELDGGLRPGQLVVLGAGSSLGKTTLTLQLADQLAATGRPVLYVAIEQGAHELTAKSLARIMQQNNPGRWTPAAYAIRSGAARKSWDAATLDGLTAAAAWYSDHVAPNLVFLEPDRKPLVTSVTTAADTIRERCGTPPVVFVDYLQLMEALNERWDERKAVDANITMLRQWARDTGGIAVVICSLNRGGYYGDASLESYKESGGIEYGADLALGLQPAAMQAALADAKAGDDAQKRAAKSLIEKVKLRDVREMEIKILKNRSGRTGGRVKFAYDAVHDLFTATKPVALDWDTTEAAAEPALL